jgi:hypothetical protein
MMWSDKQAPLQSLIGSASQRRSFIGLHYSSVNKMEQSVTPFSCNIGLRVQDFYYVE